MPTARNISHKAFECGLYEAQDVLRDAADVDMVALEPAAGFRMRERWHNRLSYRDLTNRIVLSNPGLQPVRLDREYDLFLACCQSYEDLVYVNAIENWKDKSRVSACWLDEVWTASIPRYRHWMAAISQFDHIFLANRSSVKPLSEATGRPCYWLPAGVDTVRFSQFPACPPRVVDVFSIGRRRPGMHDSLMRLAKSRQLYYLYDTCKISVANVYDPQEHRETFANTAKRSRFFLVAPPKFDELAETAGETDIGYRYYEGSAAGAVLLGQRANIDIFDQLFDWPDVVIEVNPDGSDLEKIVTDLLATPERLAAIGRRNAAEALRRHDWIYRWRTLLQTCGMEVPAGLTERAHALESLACEAMTAAAQPCGVS